MSVLVIEKSEQGIEAAVMMRDRLYAYRSDFGAPTLEEGMILRGVVDRAVKSLGAVFIRLPQGETGFLPIRPGKPVPASGAAVTVQVRRPPTDSKKAMLSQDITLPGEHLVLLPRAQGLRLSAKITDEALRQEVHALGHSLLPLPCGVILRSAAQGQTAELLRTEFQTLWKRWQTISAQENTASPRLLYAGQDLISQLILEEGARLDYVLTNDPTVVPPALSCPVRESPHPFLLHNVRSKLEKSLRRMVQLKSGATLVIDPCEAMTVIDVNSAMAAGDSAEQVNAEAAREIARLLRLRNIGGMVVVDFIDLPTDAARERLLAAVREALLEDPVKTTVHDITVLGLMELTRKRGGIPLSPLPDIPCPHCGGTGVYLTQEEDAPDA